jgi:hypothetical protein
LPSDIKKAAVVLIISAIFDFANTDFRSLDDEGLDLMMVAWSSVYTLIIAWLIRELFRGNSINQTLFLLAGTSVVELMFEISTFGFGISATFDSVELLMFVVAYFFLNTKESKVWFGGSELGNDSDT